MLPMLFLFLTYALPCLSASPAICYNRAGEVASDYFPCNSTLTGGASACCDLSAPCSPSGICYGSAGLIYRGGCTDQSWASSECAGTICPDQGYWGYVNIIACDPFTHTWCCDYSGTGGCCDASFGGWSPGAPFFSPSSLSVQGYEAIISSASSATPIATPSSSSGASVPPTVTVTTSATSAASTLKPSASRNGTTIGLAVGIPLGVIALVALGALLYRERKRKQNTPEVMTYTTTSQTNPGEAKPELPTQTSVHHPHGIQSYQPLRHRPYEVE